MLESMHAIFHLMETLKKLKRSWTHENNFTEKSEAQKMLYYFHLPLLFVSQMTYKFILSFIILQLRFSGWKTERLLSPSIMWKANWICGPLDAKID